VLAALIAVRVDHDVRKSDGTPENHVGGRALSGASGFGLLGSAAGWASPITARVLGYYGLAWAVTFNIVARGQEVEFRRNAAIDVRFGGRTAGPDSKLNPNITAP
jgi:hypothetical protein